MTPWSQIWLLVVVNAFVGGMVGLERTLLPGFAVAEFGLSSAAAASAFVVAFGVTKALVNLAAGRLADRFGRRRVLIAGWLVGIPVPILLFYAPSWSWVIAANVLLGVNQGLAWSMTLNMKLDRARREERGLVVGLNEAAGYLGLAAVAFATGLTVGSLGTRTTFLLGVVLAATALALSLFATDVPREPAPRGSLRAAFRDRALLAPSFAGLATNLKDGALWAILPLALAARGMDVLAIAAIVALYPVAWGLCQLVTGPLADRYDKRALIVAGLLVQSAGVATLALWPGLLGAAIVGAGTALAYPTLLVLVADVATPIARATSLGVYRFWRDGGYAVGALGAGVLADAAGFGAALAGVAVIVALAALVLAVQRRATRAPTH